MKNQNPEIIYHTVGKADYYNNLIGSMYVPETIVRDGFIHCSSFKEDVLQIVKNSFSMFEGTIFIVKIISDAVLAPVRFEKSSESETLYPHIYGPLNLDAVDGIGIIRKSRGQFYWPEEFSFR